MDTTLPKQAVWVGRQADSFVWAYTVMPGQDTLMRKYHNKTKTFLKRAKFRKKC